MLIAAMLQVRIGLGCVDAVTQHASHASAWGAKRKARRAALVVECTLADYIVFSDRASVMNGETTSVRHFFRLTAHLSVRDTLSVFVGRTNHLLPFATVPGRTTNLETCVDSFSKRYCET